MVRSKAAPLHILLFLPTLVSAAFLARTFGGLQSTFSKSSTSPNSCLWSSSVMDGSYVVDPQERDTQYSKGSSNAAVDAYQESNLVNMAQYLVDLHDAKAIFNFCGGMMFQLVLTDALRNHLVDLSQNEDSFVSVQSSAQTRMHHMEGYEQSPQADNRALFHGREIRQVPWAKGGRGFVLQLSLANEYNEDENDETNDVRDPDGWTRGEVLKYDGWAHDVGRVWRQADDLVSEGVTNFPTTYGPKAFSLNHRFYLHYDSFNRLWLSAEDGCEGTPAVAMLEQQGQTNPVQSFLKQFLPKH